MGPKNSFLLLLLLLLLLFLIIEKLFFSTYDICSLYNQIKTPIDFWLEEFLINLFFFSWNVNQVLINLLGFDIILDKNQILPSYS